MEPDNYMDVKSAIINRRSVRKYLDKMPEDMDIKEVLNAGIWAPSGLNNQPWKYKVLKDNEQKDLLAKCTSYGSIIKGAPVVICVFLDKKASYSRDKDILATGACIQNMLLRAYELKLGTCWLGEILNNKEKVNSLLEIDDDYELMAAIAIGFPDDVKANGSRKVLSSFTIK